MTPESIKRMTTWRGELAAELAQAQKSLTLLEAEHETAIAATRDVGTAYRDIQHALGAFSGRLAGPLVMRSRFHLQDVDAAKSRQDRGRAAVDVARGQIAELEGALRQLDALLVPAEEEAAA
jgi:hypothetical protein